MMPRRLPHSPEAEMMFLGSQLLEPDRKLGNGLQHSHFALNEHGWLFAAIRQAQSAGIRFDAIAAEQWIVNDARFDGVGGKDYIAKLLECAEGPINAEERAHFIIDLAEKRNLIDIAESLDTAAHAADVAETADVILFRHRMRLEQHTKQYPHANTGKFQCLSEIAPTNVPWLWKHRFVLDGPNIIAGPPDVGKNVFISEIISCVTTGNKWPDGTANGVSGSVLIAETEDAYDHTVVPRLLAAGANLSKCVRMRPGWAATPADIVGFRMFVPSPTISLMDIKKNSNSEQDVREMLVGWTEACRVNNCALVTPAHYNKKSDLAALQRILGSQAFGAFPRSVHCINRDDEDDTIRLLMKLKANLAPDGVEGLRFTIRHTGGAWDQSIACYWMGATDKNADDVMQARRERSSSGTDLAWLVSFLSGKGDVYTYDIWPAAAEQGISKDSLRKLVQRHSKLFDVTPMGNKSMWKLR